MDDVTARYTAAAALGTYGSSWQYVGIGLDSRNDLTQDDAEREDISLERQPKKHHTAL